MQFMVIERFKNQDARAVHARFMEKGRMMPDGLTYVDSWVDASYDRCFQVMECDDASLLQQWVMQWQDLVSFEIIPVVQSASAWKHFSSTQS
ncbi:MAG: DUF3303 family protein [Candidatus Melainabacteria bacterium]|nr:DUF3303 family protein [Candidatus Melainabacteria bacterium]